MNLITVIPLTRSKVADTLSYFTASDIQVGAVVNVPLRNKTIHAIVTEVKPAADDKVSIKQADFVIRKLGKVKAISFFPSTFIDSCRQLADYYASSIGSVIHALTSNILLENAHKIPPAVVPEKPSRDETYAIQGDDEDRMSAWRSLIRQEFARKKSIAIYVPTREEVRHMSSVLSKGIEDYIFTLHGTMPSKKIIETWGAIADTTHPVVIITTGSFSVLPRHDIDSIIIERENGRGWIGRSSPFVDIRHALEVCARKNRQTVYIADNILRVETLHRVEEHDISEGSPFKWKSISTAQDVLVDMRAPTRTEVQVENKEPESKETKRGQKDLEKFRTLSPQLEACIAKNREDNSHLFIMTARRGLAPITVCDDCDTVVACHECSTPVVLHSSKESGKNFFMCHTCGARRSAAETCSICGGWRLTPLGIGIERVAEEVRAKFPSADVYIIDSESAADEKKIAQTLQKFRTRPGSILIGTETALLHLDGPVEYAAIASFDSLFAVPDFRIYERIMYNIIRLRTLAKRAFIVQTRKPEEKVFEYGLKGNLGDFYRMVIRERKQFSYPPYSTLLKISIEGKKDIIAQDMAKVKELLEPNVVDIFPAFTASVRGNSIIHGLAKIDPSGWPNTELITKLRSLPPSVSIKINPESLL